MFRPTRRITRDWFTARNGAALLLVAAASTSAPSEARAQADVAPMATPSTDFAMSPETHVAVGSILGAFRDAPRSDDRILRLARAVAETRLVVLDATGEASESRGERARSTLREHARRLRSIEAEFARSEAATGDPIEPLRPRLRALLAALDAAADPTAPTTTTTEELGQRLARDFQIEDGRELPPQPTLRELGNPDLRGIPAPSGGPEREPSR